MIRILIAHEHRAVRKGLHVALEDEPDFLIVGEASDGGAAIAEATRLRPRVVILDSHLPDLSGSEVCEAVAERLPESRVLLVTPRRDRAVVLVALAAGAHGVVLMDTETSSLRQAVRAVASDERFLDPRFGMQRGVSTARHSRSLVPFGLSSQEIRVLEKLRRGSSDEEIGRELGLSAAKVNLHVQRAMEKLNVKRRVELTAVAVREGLA